MYPWLDVIVKRISHRCLVNTPGIAKNLNVDSHDVPPPPPMSNKNLNFSKSQLSYNFSRSNIGNLFSKQFDCGDLMLFALNLQSNLSGSKADKRTALNLGGQFQASPCKSLGIPCRNISLLILSTSTPGSHRPACCVNLFASTVPISAYCSK